MAITFSNGETKYRGAVLRKYSHMWADGMLEEYASVWDADKQEILSLTVGYYGSDGCNLAGCHADVDASRETWRAVLRSWKPEALKAYADSVTQYKRGIRKGTRAVVIRGKKVPKGTKLDVFWVGERQTYRARQLGWLNETETVAGCYDETGAKVWIKAEYLKNIDPIKSPSPKERKKWIQAWLVGKAQAYGAPFKLRQQ